MLWMMLIMGLPVAGIALFFTLPLGTALPAYLALLGFFGLYQVLMMRTMHLPVRTGGDKIIGSTAMVLNWEGDAGQVIQEGEIWQAKTHSPQKFTRGEKVVIHKISGLTLWIGAARAETKKASFLGGRQSARR